MAALARAKDLRIYVGGKIIVKGLDLVVKSGSMHLIVGRVGSGKSLVLKSLAGVAQLYGGIEIRGLLEVTGSSPLEAMERGEVVYVPHDPTSMLSVRSLVAAGSLRREMMAASEALMECLKIAERSRARLVLVEELSSYLDERQLPKAMEALRRIASRGGAVVIADHSEHPLAKYVDSVTYIDGGVEISKVVVAEPRRSGAASIRSLAVSYGFRIVDLSELDLDVGPGDVVGVAAPNARGKTTLVRALIGSAKVVRGTARLKGSAYVVPQIPPRLFAYPSIELEAKALSVDARALGEPWRSIAYRNPYTLSLGESRALMMQLALASPRKWLLVVDELALGLDDDVAKLFCEAIEEAASLGKSAIVTGKSRSDLRWLRSAEIVELS